MNGWQLLGRTIRVDHVDKYKAPKKLDEENKDENGDAVLLEYEATGAEGKGYQVYNALDTQKKISDIAGQRRAKAAPKGPVDEDDEWAKSFEESLQNLEKDMEVKKKKKKKSKKELKKDKKDLMEVMKESKRLKQEAKKAKEDAKRKKEDQKARGVKVAKSEESSESSSSSSSSS